MTYEDAMQQGDLDGAIAVLERQRADAPTPAVGFMLVQTLALAERFDDAAALLCDVVAGAPELAPLHDDIGAVLQADAARHRRRRDAAEAGRRKAPGPPPPHALALVKALVQHAGGDRASAATSIAEAKQARPARPGTVTYGSGMSARFASVVDTDDLTGGGLELAIGADLLDVDFAQCASITWLPPRGFQDTIWPITQVTLQDGGRVGGRAFSRYVGTGAHAIPEVRMGRMTMWDHEGGYRVGFGQRDYELEIDGGLSMTGVLQLRSLVFGDAPPEQRGGFFSRLLGRA